MNVTFEIEIPNPENTYHVDFDSHGKQQIQLLTSFFKLRHDCEKEPLNPWPINKCQDVPKIASKWMTILLKSHGDEVASPFEIRAVILGLQALVEHSQFDDLNELIATVPIEQINLTQIITVARTLFPVRSKLSGWDNFIKKCREELTSRGKDGSSFLVGTD